MYLCSMCKAVAISEEAVPVDNSIMYNSNSIGNNSTTTLINKCIKYVYIYIYICMHIHTHMHGSDGL